MQKHVNLVDLVKSFPTNILLQNLASIQKRTSPVKLAHLAEQSGKGSISNLSTKVRIFNKGMSLLTDAMRNKGTAFTESERERLGDLRVARAASIAVRN